MQLDRRSARATAQLLAINAALYGKERDRTITRYRFSMATLSVLSGRNAPPPDFLRELEYELAELEWAFVRIGAEFGVVSLEKADTWVKLASKRLKEADINFLDVSENVIDKGYDNLYPPDDEDGSND